MQGHLNKDLRRALQTS